MKMQEHSELTDYLQDMTEEELVDTIITIEGVKISGVSQRVRDYVGKLDSERAGDLIDAAHSRLEDISEDYQVQKERIDENIKIQKVEHILFQEYSDLGDSIKKNIKGSLLGLYPVLLKYGKRFELDDGTIISIENEVVIIEHQPSSVEYRYIFNIRPETTTESYEDEVEEKNWFGRTKKKKRIKNRKVKTGDISITGCVYKFHKDEIGWNRNYQLKPEGFKWNQTNSVIWDYFDKILNNFENNSFDIPGMKIFMQQWTELPERIFFYFEQKKRELGEMEKKSSQMVEDVEDLEERMNGN